MSIINHKTHIKHTDTPPVFLINLYGAPLAQRVFLFGTAQFSLWASGAVNYDYIVTNSINSLLIGSRCILNGVHTNHFGPKLQNLSKDLHNNIVT